MNPELWIPLTLAAAFLQNLRSLLQKQASATLSSDGAAYLRFLFALPWVWGYALLTGAVALMPLISLESFSFALMGSIGQIFGTRCLIASFTTRNFAVGTAFSKTEAAQTALFGLLVLEERVQGVVLGGIGISFLGVLLLSNVRRLRETSGRDAGLWLGLASGAGFAVAAVGFRGAALALPEGTVVQRAALVLALAVTLQTLLMSAYLQYREPGFWLDVVRVWRQGVGIGLVGALASVGWFTAMTLVNAALVRALGQVELVFTFLTSVWLFRERVRGSEVAGVVLVVAGLVLLVLGTPV